MRISFWKQLPPNPGPAFRKLGADPVVGADRLCHLPQIRPRDLTQRRYGVDRTDPLRQQRIGRQFGQFTAPDVGAQDLGIRL